MNILIITQKIDKNDGYFGFFHGWLAEFAKACGHVTAIGLEVGMHDLPPNVKVYSLGKESNKSRLQYISRLLRYSWRERRQYDVVLAHMSPLYVIVGWPLWKLLGKRIGMWYVHRHVDLKLRISAKLADVIFTAVPESFRMKSSKVHYMGQAVPLEKYRKEARSTEDGVRSTKGKADASAARPFTIVSIGRITPIKNLDILVEAAATLRDKGIMTHIDLVGDPVQPTDHACKAALVKLIAERKMGDQVTFVGSVPNKDIPAWYWQSDLSINLCPTGGLDKAVLESMAASTPVMVSNRAFKDYYGQYADRMVFAERDAADLARKLEAYIGSSAADKAAITAKLLHEVEARSSLSALIGRIVSILGERAPRS